MSSLKGNKRRSKQLLLNKLLRLRLQWKLLDLRMKEERMKQLRKNDELLQRKLNVKDNYNGKENMNVKENYNVNVKENYNVNVKENGNSQPKKWKQKEKQLPKLKQPPKENV
jgi:hypothetical protein